MRRTAILFVITTVVALGQKPADGNADRTFQFIHTEGVQNLQEVATAIRTIADIKQASVDTAQKSLAVRGTAAQIGVAEWLWKELDQFPVPAASQDSATHEYRMPEGSLGSEHGETAVRVFYLPNTRTVQDFQEVATLVRTTAEIRRVFTYNGNRALIMRGTAGQMAHAEWLIGQLGGPPSTQSVSAAPAYRLSKDQSVGDGADLVRVFYLPHTATVQAFQEAATLIRTIAEIRRVFTYNTPRALALRGTDDQIALAEWLLQALDQAANAQPDAAPREYRPSASTDDVVRVFTLTHAATAQRVQEVATEVRTATGVPHLFIYNPARALALRGTVAQIAQADLLIKERDK